MIEVMKDLVCKIRLCDPDIVIHSGLAEIKEANKCTKNKGVYMTVKMCGRCGRKVNNLWTKDEINLYKEAHAKKAISS